MNLKKQFIYDPSIEVSASQIGISKWHWISTNSNDPAIAREIMKSNRFDVLPIINEDGLVTSFFSTQEWNNYENLNKLPIKDTQTIYYRLSFKDLIRKFKNDQKHFYFLTDYEQILGLVSYVNLNCQLVYNYLFYIIADIERSISKIIKSYMSPEEVLNQFSISKDNHLLDLVKEYNKQIELNSDNDFFQYMYLQTIGIVLKKFQNNLPIEYKRLLKFASKFGSEGTYNLIRRKVMHPIRPILSDIKSIDQIDELLSDYEEIRNIIEKVNDK